MFFQARPPRDSSSLKHYHKRLGEAGVEELLSRSIEAAEGGRAERRSGLKRVVVDSMVQEKDVAFPTDSRPLEVARQKEVEAARQKDTPLRQTMPG